MPGHLCKFLLCDPSTGSLAPHDERPGRRAPHEPPGAAAGLPLEPDPAERLRAAGEAEPGCGGGGGAPPDGAGGQERPGRAEADPGEGRRRSHCSRESKRERTRTEGRRFANERYRERKGGFA